MDLLNNFMNYNFEEPVLKNEIIKHLTECDWKYFFNCKSIESLRDSKYNYEIATLTTSELMHAAIAALLAFVQNNFTGPENDDFLGPVLSLEDEDIDELLAMDSEELNTNVSSSELLLFSKLSFEYLMKQSIPEIFIVRVWYLRYILVHQKLIETKSMTLFNKFTETSASILSEIADKLDTRNQYLVKLEILQGYLHYRNATKVNEILEELMKQINISFEIEGGLGNRTKFQTKALPQLLLRVSGLNESDIPKSEITHPQTNLPVLLPMEDEVRLEKIQFNELADNENIELPSIIQNILLSKILYLQLTQPRYSLSDEEIEPFLRTLLYQERGPWIIRIQVLFIKIKLELSHRRTVERCLKQCETIIKAICEVQELSANQRLSHIFASNLTPRWEIVETLIEIMLSLGLVKDALLIALDINKWDDVIVCYTFLNLRHKAEEIIRQEIKKKPSVEMYCLLGDATGDIENFEKAWELSEHRSSRPQRYLGNYYFNQKQYATAIPYFEKSLSINSLQDVLWLKLGFAAMEIEDWKLAASAYLRYTQIEPYGFESWNNLSKAYIKLGEKKRAKKILEEALKCNYNNWMVWENYMCVSTDTGNFSDALTAYERLLELREKFYDLEVLTILVNAICTDKIDAKGIKAGSLTARAIKMLGHISSKLPNESSVFELSARLHSKEPLKKADKLQQVYRCYANSRKWSDNPEMCEKILKVIIDLSETVLSTINPESLKMEKIYTISQLTSARLTAQSVVRSAEAGGHESCLELISQLKELQIKMTTELKMLL